VFFLGFTDAAAAVTVRGSPGKTAGALALHDSVMGGGFLQPTGKKAKLNRGSTKADCRIRLYIRFFSAGNVSTFAKGCSVWIENLFAADR